MQKCVCFRTQFELFGVAAVFWEPRCVVISLHLVYVQVFFPVIMSDWKSFASEMLLITS